MDPLDKAKESMSVIEKVLAGVPGIKGYKEKELRRETDKTVRTMLAQRLDDQSARLDGLQADLARSGQLGLLDDLAQASKKLQRLSDRVRTASYGYAPLFDAVKVKEEELDALAQFDQGLFMGEDRIKTIIDNLTGLVGQPEQAWSEPIRALNTTLDNLNTEFNHRSEVILQTSGPAEQPEATDSADLE